MKKVLVCICTGAMIAGLAACGAKKENPNDNVEETFPVEETQTPSPSPDITDDAGQDNAEPDADAGSDWEELTGWSEEMEGLKAAISGELGDNYWPNMALTADMLEMGYGITADMYDDYMAEIPMMSVQVDSLIIVKAKEGQAEAVEEALNAYRDNQINNTLQYPSNLSKIQASRVGSAGRWVYFVLLGGDIMEYEEQGDEAVIEYCQQQNDRVIKIITQNAAQ